MAKSNVNVVSVVVTSPSRTSTVWIILPIREFPFDTGVPLPNGTLVIKSSATKVEVSEEMFAPIVALVERVRDECNQKVPRED